MKEPRPRVHTCTVCGKKEPWGEDWSWYGSINHMDACPDDLPLGCTPDCIATVADNVKSGKWKLPTLGNGGMAGPNVIFPRVGY